MKKHGSEVRNMLYTEWNMEDACRVAAEEAREQGKLEGEADSIRKLKDVLPPKVLAEKFQLPLEDVLRILDADSATALQKQ